MSRLNRSKHRVAAWLTALETRVHPKIAAVALPNKLARIAWAVRSRRGVHGSNLPPNVPAIRSSQRNGGAYVAYAVNGCEPRHDESLNAGHVSGHHAHYVIEGAGHQ